MKKLTNLQKMLRKRLLEITFNNKASHLGSSFSNLDIVMAVYQEKNKDDIFVLSNGHSGLALYTVLEHHKLLKFKPGEQLKVHPERAFNKNIAVTTGSLGQGLPIAVGLAIGNPHKKIFCTISDGEAQEGSIWEALRLIKDLGLTNIMVLVNANGWGAYSTIDLNALQKRFKGFGYTVTPCDGHDLEKLQNNIQHFIDTGQPQLLFCQTTVNHFPFLKDQDAHYYVMTEQDYHQAQERLNIL